MIAIESFKTRLEAEIAKGFLESQGIQSVIQADDAGGMRGFPMQFVYGVELLVDEKDEIKAKKLLSEDRT